MRIRRLGCADVTCWLVILAQLSPLHSFDDDQRRADRVLTLTVDPLVPGTAMRREVPDALARLRNRCQASRLPAEFDQSSRRKTLSKVHFETSHVRSSLSCRSPSRRRRLSANLEALPRGVNSRIMKHTESEDICSGKLIRAVVVARWGWSPKAQVADHSSVWRGDDLAVALPLN